MLIGQWQYGKVRIGNKMYNFEAKLCQENQETYGINESNIIKLYVYKDKVDRNGIKTRDVAMLYDRGWSTEPHNKSEISALNRIIDRFKR